MRIPSHVAACSAATTAAIPSSSSPAFSAAGKPPTGSGAEEEAADGLEWTSSAVRRIHSKPCARARSSQASSSSGIADVCSEDSGDRGTEARTQTSGASERETMSDRTEAVAGEGV